MKRGVPSLLCRALAIAGITGGCILPPPVSIETETNQRPVVLTEQVKPSTAQFEINLNCSRCTFTLPVDDPNESDDVSTRWFIDYDLGDIGTQADLRSPSAGGAARVPLSYVLELSQHPTLRVEGTTHTMDVVLSDHGFSEGVDPVNRAVPANAGVAYYRWTLTLARRGTRCDDPQNICTSDTP